MPSEIAPGIWYHPRSETGILKGVTLTMGAAQDVGRQHYSTGQELGRADLVAWVQEIDRYHREHNGWLGFAYSFAVGRDHDPAKAHIFEGRGWGAVGAHTLNHNEDLGVVFLGNDDRNVADATPGVRRAIRLLFTTPTGTHLGASHRPLREVHGHRETYSTDCPGDELEAWVKAGLPAVAGPKPTPAPPKPKGKALPIWYHRPLSRGDRGSDVATLKRRLRRLGYKGIFPGPFFGPGLDKAVRRFQQLNHLTPDGVFGPITARALRAAW